MKIRDVVIIGGGAAGASAAFHLATAGHKVALLEKNIDKKIKPCGGGMSAAVQNWFPFDLKTIVDEVIRTVEFSWCLSDQVVAELPGSAPFWIVRREKLDELLTTQAVDAGAELISPFQVNRITKAGKVWEVTSTANNELVAKTIVIADGSSSPWPQKFGLGPRNPHHATTTSVRLEGRGNLKAETTRFEFGLVNHGFAWVFPIKGGVNIGIGTFIGTQEADNERILEKLLPDLGFNSNDGQRQKASLRVWNGHHDLHNDQIIAIGDAASLCDPFLAEGLRPALMSGFEGANCINQLLKGNINSLDLYTETMRLRWGNSMAWGRRISQVFYRFPKVGYQLGIKRPTAPQRIAEILSGNMDYGDIAQRVIKRLLFKAN